MSIRNDIKMDLLNQLERKNIHGSQYVDLVKDYISLCEIKNKLIKDIKDRGVSIKWSNGEAQGGFKKNDSIGELNKTNAQMLRILNDLGLKASSAEVVDPNEEM